MEKSTLYPAWKDIVEYPTEGPGRKILTGDGSYKAVLVGLEAGQTVPSHPGPAASYHVLEGQGKMIVEDKKLDIIRGSTVVVQEGVPRGIEAGSRIAILASHAGMGRQMQMKMPYKRMGVVGLISMGAMAALMIVFGRIFGRINPMAAMMFSRSSDFGMGVWGMMIVPAIALLLMFGMMFFFYRGMKKSTQSATEMHHPGGQKGE